MKPIQIWRARLGELPVPDEELLSILSPAEVSRSQRFVNPRHRLDFIRVHAVLRQILAGYGPLEPARLEFETGKAGKPALGGSLRGLFFNLAHSQDLALVAVSQGGEVGVDLEYNRESTDIGLVARHFFSPAETAWLDSLHPGLRRAAFYELWTVKEAVLKASGLGLEGGLARVTLVEPAKISAGVQKGEANFGGQVFTIWIFEPDPGGYSAAAASLQENGCEWDGRLLNWGPV